MGRKKSNLVQYGGYSVASVEADTAKADVIAGNRWFSFEVGDNVVRFIPPKVGETSPFRVTAMHYIDAVPGLDKLLVFACPRVELKQPCPACQEAERLNKSPNPLDRERAYQLSASLRVFASVIDRRIADPADGIKIMSMGKMIHGQLKTIRSNPRLGGDFTDPTDDGFDVIITREGTGKMDTRYSCAADRNSSGLADDVDVINWIIENQPDLDAMVNPVVPEELLAAWESTVMRASSSSSRGKGGSKLMKGRKPRASAVSDAKVESEYDEDFNVVVT